MSADRSLILLVNASRVDPTLRAAVQEVEHELDDLRRALYQASVQIDVLDEVTLDHDAGRAYIGGPT